MHNTDKDINLRGQKHHPATSYQLPTPLTAPSSEATGTSHRQQRGREAQGAARLSRPQLAANRGGRGRAAERRSALREPLSPLPRCHRQAKQEAASWATGRLGLGGQPAARGPVATCRRTRQPTGTRGPFSRFGAKPLTARSAEAAAGWSSPRVCRRRRTFTFTAPLRRRPTCPRARPGLSPPPRTRCLGPPGC